jgi:MFS family permease
MRHRIDRNIKLLLTATLLYGFSFSVWDLFFNLYILSLNINSDMLGIIRSATPLAALALGLPLGLLVDRISQRKSLLIGLGVLFIGMFLGVHIPNPILIFLCGLIQGVGYMLFLVAQPAFIITHGRQENSMLIFSLNYGLLTLSSTIGNMVAGALPAIIENKLGIPLNSAQSYQWVITAGIFLATTSLIPIFLIKEKKSDVVPDKVRVPIKKAVSELLTRPLVRRLATTNCLIGLGAGLLVPYLNVFLRGKFAISDNTLGLIFSITSLVVFLAFLISPWLAKVANSRVIPLVSVQSLGVFFLITLGFSPVLWLATVSLLIRSALMQMTNPLLDSYAMLISRPDERGAVSSIRGMGWQLGQTIGTFSSGFVQARYGFSPLFITTAILYALATALSWFWFRPPEKELSTVGSIQ